MSVYNSEIYLRNDGYQTINIGTLSILPNELVKIWDTKSVNVNQSVWDKFYQVRDNHDNDNIYGLLISEMLTVVHDGLDISPSTAPNFLSNAYAEYSKVNSVTKLMSTGIKTDTLKEKDGRMNVTPTPVGFGWLTWFTGAGDSAVSGRGEGQKMVVNIDDGYDYGEVKISFNEPVHVHDGQIYWGADGAFDVGDTFSVGVDIHATTAEAVDGYGNANKVDSGLGFNLFVPANGDGYWNIDLSTADNVSPITVYGVQPTGFWDVDEETGLVRAADTPGAGGFNLADTAMPRAYFMKNVPMGHPLRVFDIDVYKTEFVHQSWDVVLEVSKPSAGAGWVAGWMLTFRRENT